MDIFKRIVKFNADAGTPIGQTRLSDEASINELNMLREELFELEQALGGLRKVKGSAGQGDTWVALNSPEEERVEIADALADIMYVAMGTMAKLGIDFNKVMEEVCRSNETKYTADGKLVKNEAGKIQKGENFSPPNLSFVKTPQPIQNLLQGNNIRVIPLRKDGEPINTFSTIRTGQEKG